jgi:cytochrome b involved in lipid metabolism
MHNSKDNCWINIGKKVYDVTNFIDEHPGGAESFLDLKNGEDG